MSDKEVSKTLQEHGPVMMNGRVVVCNCMSEFSLEEFAKHQSLALYGTHMQMAHDILLHAANNEWRRDEDISPAAWLRFRAKELLDRAWD